MLCLAFVDCRVVVSSLAFLLVFRFVVVLKSVSVCCVFLVILYSCSVPFCVWVVVLFSYFVFVQSLSCVYGFVCVCSWVSMIIYVCFFMSSSVGTYLLCCVFY